MANRAMDSFVALFVDDSQLKKSFQELSGFAARSGASIGERFAAAFKQGSMIGGTTGMIGARSLMPALPELGGAGGGPSPAAASLAQMAQIISRSVTPALSSLNPAMGEFVQTGAAAARSAGSFGVVLGGVAIAGTVLSAVIGKYVGQAKEATEVTFGISQALKNLDAGGAEAQFNKARKGIERFALSFDQLTGRVKSGAWEKLVAAFDILGERITGTNQDRFNTLLRSASANIEIASRVPVAKAQAGERAFNAGLLEREATLNIQNAKTVEELNAAYDKSAQAIRDRTAAEISQLQVQLEADTAAGKTAAGALAQIEINKKLAAQSADLAAKETERQRALMRAMDERQAHAVALGRVSMRDQLDFERAAMGDPRRTLQEQQVAEQGAFQTQRAMAESILTFQSQITGKSMLKEAIEIGRSFMSELVTGSAAWFAQVSKVSDLFVRMREEAKGIFSQQASIAEGEAARQFQEQKKFKDDRRAAIEDENIVSANVAGKEAVAAAQERLRQRREAREGVPTETDARISINDISGFLDQVRRRDEGALSGDRVRIGDLSGAIGRMDLFRKMDKEGLAPREAFSRLTEDPSKHLARAIEGVTGGFADVTPVLSRIAEAGDRVVETFLRIAGASPSGGGAQRGGGERQRGGPALSEENRQAIMDAISTRLQDEALAMYGRR